MEWLAQYAEFDLVNEQKLALVFVREVGAIDMLRIASWILRLLMPVHAWRFISSAILDSSRRKGRVVTLTI